MLKTKHSGIKTDLFFESIDAGVGRFISIKTIPKDGHEVRQPSFELWCSIYAQTSSHLSFTAAFDSIAGDRARKTDARAPPSALLPFPFFRDRDHRLRPSQSRRDHLIDDKMSNAHIVLFLALFETMGKFCFSLVQ